MKINDWMSIDFFEKTKFERNFLTWKLKKGKIENAAIKAIF